MVLKPEGIPMFGINGPIHWVVHLGKFNKVDFPRIGGFDGFRHKLNNSSDSLLLSGYGYI